MARRSIHTIGLEPCSGTNGDSSFALLMTLPLALPLALSLPSSGPCSVFNGAAYVVLQTTGMTKHLISNIMSYTTTIWSGGSMTRGG